MAGRTRTRIGVLLSGRGSNFEAIYRFSTRDKAPFEIVSVISDRRQARGLSLAAQWGIPACHVSPRKFPSKSAFELAIVDILAKHRVELVCLAGYMRILGDPLLKAYPGHILNIHPSLLPSFPGLNAQQQALDYGVKVTGCTVHFIDSGVDSGPIILQAAVPVQESDTEEGLSQRILAQEHRIYPEAVDLFCRNRLQIQGRRVIILP